MDYSVIKSKSIGWLSEKVINVEKITQNVTLTIYLSKNSISRHRYIRVSRDFDSIFEVLETFQVILEMTWIL